MISLHLMKLYIKIFGTMILKIFCVVSIVYFLIDYYLNKPEH